MFVILYYDANQKRVARLLKKCRQYLTWVQNSVFEGEISDASFKILKEELKKILKPEEDSVIYYVLRDTKYTERGTMGKEKNEVTQFI